MAEETHKGGSLTTTAFWLLLAKGAAFVLGFALPLLLVRRLSQLEFGLYKQAFLVVNTAQSTLHLGFSLSAYYFLPREEGRDGQGRVVFNILLFNLAVGGAAWLALALQPGILEAIFNGAGLTGEAALIGCVILLWLVASILEIVLVARQETRLATVLIVASQLTRTLALLGAAAFFGSLRALLWAAVLHGVVQAAVLLAYMRARFGGFWRRFDWGAMRRQLSYALPLGLAGLLFTLQIDLHNYFVSASFGPEMFAVYAVAFFHLPLISIIAEAVGQVMIPRTSYLQKQDDRREIVHFTARAMRKLSAVYLPLCGFMLVVGRELIALLFTESYLASWPVFAVNLALFPIYCLTVDPIMRAYAEHRYFLLKLRAVLLTLFVGAWLLSKDHLGLVGMGALVVGMNAAERLATAAKAARIVGATRRDAALFKDVGKVAAAVLFAALAALAARALLAGAGPALVVAACGVVFGLAYPSMLLLLGVLAPDERDSLRRGLTRFHELRPGRRRAAAPHA